MIQYGIRGLWSFIKRQVEESLYHWCRITFVCGFVEAFRCILPDFYDTGLIKNECLHQGIVVAKPFNLWKKLKGTEYWNWNKHRRWGWLEKQSELFCGAFFINVHRCTATNADDNDGIIIFCFTWKHTNKSISCRVPTTCKAASPASLELLKSRIAE